MAQIDEPTYIELAFTLRSRLALCAIKVAAVIVPIRRFAWPAVLFHLLRQKLQS
jgi:hypothetical protein